MYKNESKAFDQDHKLVDQEQADQHAELTDDEMQRIIFDNLMAKSISQLKSDIRKLSTINNSDALDAITIVKSVIAVKKG